jgi:soluble cytochrome b562
MQEEEVLQSDEQFDVMIAENQRRAILDALKKITATLSENKVDSELKSFLVKNKEAIAQFTQKINELSKPEINITNDNKEFIGGLQIMTEAINKSNDKMDKILAKLGEEKKKEEWFFTIQTSSNGIISAVRAKEV